jgi:hypothetical protein
LLLQRACWWRSGLLPTACCMQNINITKDKIYDSSKDPVWRTLTD